jgi:hypothetical protein
MLRCHQFSFFLIVIPAQAGTQRLQVLTGILSRMGFIFTFGAPGFPLARE